MMIMIKQVFKDSVADAAAKVLSASLPFITIGQMWSQAIGNVSAVVGLVAMAVLIVRSILLLMRKREVKKNESLDKIVGDLLSFPYAVALCSTILVVNGIDASFGLWFAAILAVMAVSGNIAPKGQQQ